MMPEEGRTHPPGIRQRHGRSCRLRLAGDSCPWQAEVYCKGEFKKVRKQLPTLEKAIAWRESALIAVAEGTMLGPLSPGERKAMQARIDSARIAKLSAGRDELAEALAMHRAVMQAVERAGARTPSRSAKAILGDLWGPLETVEAALIEAINAPGNRIEWYRPNGRAGG